MIGRSMNNWASMPEGKSKYQAYLASREWGAIKQQVHARSGGICERCHHNPGESVHHLTYERKYREHLDDLRHVCTPCHEFEHGIRKRDPFLDTPVKLLGREVRSVYLAGRISPPHGAWRSQIAPSWDESGHGSSGHADLDDSLYGLYADLPDGRELKVTGPFWSEVYATGGGHAWYSRGDAVGIHAAEGAFAEIQHGQLVPQPADLVVLQSRILDWLQAADFVFAWIEDRECFGTLWELGYACCLPNSLVVVASREFDRELWLPATMARLAIVAPSAGEAWAKLWANERLDPWSLEPWKWGGISWKAWDRFLPDDEIDGQTDDEPEAPL